MTRLQKLFENYFYFTSFYKSIILQGFKELLQANNIHITMTINFKKQNKTSQKILEGYLTLKY